MKNKIIAICAGIAVTLGLTVAVATAAHAAQFTYVSNAGSLPVVARDYNGFSFTVPAYSSTWSGTALRVQYVNSPYFDSCYNINGNDVCIGKFATPYWYYFPENSYNTVYRWQ